jgi:hypothetical protein
MRALVIGLGVAAMLVAAVLASRDNPVRVNSLTQAVVSAPTTTGHAAAVMSTRIGVQSTATMAPTQAQQSAPAAARFFFVREPGAFVVYDPSTARPRLSLPAQGMLSADRKHYYFARPDLPSTTLLAGFDVDTSGVTELFSQGGQWRLTGVSATGRWIVLTRIPGEAEKQTWLRANQWKTELQIVDPTDAHVAHSVELDGNFDVDAISADGTSLFLIQHLPVLNPDHYQVRLYDLIGNQLQDGALVDKRAPDEVMVGEPWDAVASPDGEWLLTLYLRTRQNTAFIHALNLENKFAMCIDLPSGTKDLSLLKHYTLALAPDGRTVYAINPALGTLAIVDLDQFEVSRLVSYPARLPANAKSQLDAPPGRSTVSQDGRAVYFSDGSAVWLYDTQTQTVKSLRQMTTPVLGLYASADGKQLYIAYVNGQIQILDTAAIATNGPGS